MIHYKCDQCGAEMQSPDSLAGQVERCPECEAGNTVPPAAGQQEENTVLRQNDEVSAAPEPTRLPHDTSAQEER